jgi:hypothetical protein
LGKAKFISDFNQRGAGAGIKVFWFFSSEKNIFPFCLFGQSPWEGGFFAR